jgi:predicted O-linked N-acetylglucosamine transferase (SPINDLY family)
VTWIGYPASTGLPAIDYRLSDAHLDPPGLNDAEYCEQTIRLPNCFWCYDPLTNEPRVNPLPALSGAPITFGCLNNFCKVNQEVLELWAQVLKVVPDSRLMLLSDPGSHRDQTLATLKRLGVEPARVEMVHRRPRREYLQLYHRIDIALDTFPYTGHTTTLDALWMGVPVVSRSGTRAVSRATLSVATNLGLENELIAKSAADYVCLARNLTEDLAELASLREKLRPSMEDSPVMDQASFARGMERSFRKVWQKWCGKGELSTGPGA